jgi:hypothetical protein
MQELKRLQDLGFDGKITLKCEVQIQSVTFLISPSMAAVRKGAGGYRIYRRERCHDWENDKLITLQHLRAQT